MTNRSWQKAGDRVGKSGVIFYVEPNKQEKENSSPRLRATIRVFRYCVFSSLECKFPLLQYHAVEAKLPQAGKENGKVKRKKKKHNAMVSPDNFFPII